MIHERVRRPLMGWSKKMQQTRAEIELTARTNMTIMIRGEPGTGKELVAQEIHAKSKRANGPFVKVNCAALPEPLIETELFGCEKGAYTGAVPRKGRFELADGGTLFLDEVGELNVTSQPKLLRVLETHEVDRIGGQRPVRADFRLIVATNQDLENMIRTKRFRADLYERLNMDSIWTAPLRERLEDIPLLADYFIGVFVPEAGRLVTGVSPKVLDRFQKYHWPGNVRQLENVIRRAVFRGQSELIQPEDLPDFDKITTAPEVFNIGDYHQLMNAYSRQLVMEALRLSNGNRTKAAVWLHLSRSQLHRLVHSHGLTGNDHDEKAN
jgi:Nif-specific regulatory protein